MGNMIVFQSGQCFPLAIFQLVNLPAVENMKRIVVSKRGHILHLEMGALTHTDTVSHNKFSTSKETQILQLTVGDLPLLVKRVLERFAHCNVFLRCPHCCDPPLPYRRCSNFCTQI